MSDYGLYSVFLRDDDVKEDEEAQVEAENAENAENQEGEQKKVENKLKDAGIYHIKPHNPCPPLKIQDSSVVVFTPKHPFNFPKYLKQTPEYHFNFDSIKTSYNKPEEVPLSNVTSFRSVGWDIIPTSTIRKPQPLFRDVDSNEREKLIHPKQIFRPTKNRDKKITKKSQLFKTNAPNPKIKQITITGQKIDEEENTCPTNLLSFFPNVEYVQFKDMGLRKLKFKQNQEYPSILWVDVSKNEIYKEKSIYDLIDACPNLQSLDISGNPVSKPDLINQILWTYPNINMINGEIVSLKKWYDAIIMDPRNARSQRASNRFFHHVVLSIPELKYAYKKLNGVFDPLIITHLSLPNCMLNGVYLYEFLNLVSLNLANNQISNFENAGIENLKNLISVNLEGNQISTTSALNPFKQCPHLLHIILRNNYLVKYRNKIILKFRNNAGSSALAGIQSIDGVPVTLEEFLHAIGEIRQYDYQKLIQEKWIRNVEKVIGSYYVKKPAMFSKILHNLQIASFANRGLHQIDLYHFTNLRYLSLRNNFLNKVHNLHNMAYLEYLDLSGNIYLDVYTLLEQLKLCKSLHFLFLARDCWEAEFINSNNDYQVPDNFFKEDAYGNSIYNKKYRESVLNALVPHLNFLNVLDRIPISYIERFKATASKLDQDDAETQAKAEDYKTALAIFGASGQDTKVELTDEKIEDVLNDIYGKTKVLLKLQNLNLKNNRFLKFDQFQKLTILNLSHNQITDIKSTGIYKLTKLQHVDLSHNKIAIDPHEIAKHITKEKMPNLISFSIHHNKSDDNTMTTTKTLGTTRTGKFSKSGSFYKFDYRNEIIRKLERVLDPQDSFIYLDYNISPTDLYLNYPQLFDNPKESSLRKRNIENPNELIQQLALKFRTKAKHNDRSKIKQIDLSRSGINTVDLRSMPNLTNIDLSRNKLDELETIPKFDKLQTINFCYNEFEKNQVFIQVINNNPTLRNIGIGFQDTSDEESTTTFAPKNKKHVEIDLFRRATFLKAFLNSMNEQTKGRKVPPTEEQLLRWAKTPFKAIDNYFITPSEIDNTMALYSSNQQPSMATTYPKNTTKNIPSFRYLSDAIIWNMAASRYYALKQEGIESTLPEQLPDDVDTIDLSHSELIVKSLTRIQLEEIIPCMNDNIRILSLAHNNLTHKMLLRLGCKYFLNIEHLDISYNKIGGDFNELISFLSQFPDLRRLDFHHNPICPNPSDFHAFMNKFPPISQVDFHIEMINGIKITQKDRVDMVKEINPSGADTFNTSYILQSLSPDWKELQNIDLSKKEIVDITPIKECTELISLSLAYNKITKISKDVFAKLVNLQVLDLRNNKIDMSLDEIIDVLGECPNLQVLYLENATKQKDITKGKNLDKICTKMKGLQSIDHHPNVHNLLPHQWVALNDLRAITGWYFPNKTANIDLSNCNDSYTQNQIETIVESVSLLRPTSLYLSETLYKFSFEFIHKVKTLETLNGEPIRDDMKLNADKQAMINQGKKVDEAANKLINAGLAADLIDKVQENAEGLDSKIEQAKDYALLVGTILSKWEIIITFQQILTQIILYIDRIKWPAIYLDLSFLYWIFSIDLSFLSFFLDIQMPVYLSYISLFLYTVGPPLMFLFFHHEWNESRFRDALCRHGKTTVIISIYGLFCLFLCSWGLGFIFDFNHVLHVKSMTNNWLSWGIILSGISLLILICFWIFMCFFRKKIATDQLFWQNLNLFKRRASLFGITVLYSPGCKFFVELIQCDDTGTHSYSFTDVLCLNSLQNFTLVHLAAIIFGITYAIAIPTFFIYLINQGVECLDKYCGIIQLRTELEDKKQQYKTLKKATQEELEEKKGSITLVQEKEWETKDRDAIIKSAKKELERFEKEVNDKYEEKANSYDHPAAYLYNQYTRHDRYTKVVGLLKKLAMMLFTAFIPRGWLQSIASNGMLWLMSIYQTVLAPFIVSTENLMETFGQWGNSITLLIGESLQHEFFQSEIYTQVIAPAILVAIVGLLLSIFIVLVVKYHCKCCVHDKKAKEDDESEYTYEYEWYDVDEPEDAEEAKVDDIEHAPGDISKPKADTEQSEDIKSGDELGELVDDYYSSSYYSEDYEQNDEASIPATPSVPPPPPPPPAIPPPPSKNQQNKPPPSPPKDEHNSLSPPASSDLPPPPNVESDYSSSYYSDEFYSSNDY